VSAGVNAALTDGVSEWWSVLGYGSCAMTVILIQNLLPTELEGL
jgi:hypothetical protein